MLFMFEAKMGLLPFNSVQGSVSLATFILNLKSVVCVHQCENFYLFQRGKDDTKKWIFYLFIYLLFSHNKDYTSITLYKDVAIVKG